MLWLRIDNLKCKNEECDRDEDIEIICVRPKTAEFFCNWCGNSVEAEVLESREK